MGGGGRRVWTLLRVALMWGRRRRACDACSVGCILERREGVAERTSFRKSRSEREREKERERRFIDNQEVTGGR